jgi:hypothetical protein
LERGRPLGYRIDPTELEVGLFLRICAFTVLLAPGLPLMAQPQDAIDFSAVLQKGTLTIGTNCGETRACKVRFGSTVHLFSSPVTVRPSGSGSALVYVYADNAGNLIAGSTANLICKGCSYARGVTSFPPGVAPLYTWAVLNGSFDPNGGTDLRASLTGTDLMSGAGIQISESEGTTTVSLDGTLTATRVLAPPKSSQSPCSAGQFSYDESFYYVCVGPNSWKRAALAGF